MNSISTDLHVIKKFFEINGLPLNGTLKCSEHMATHLFLEAQKVSNSFSRFFLAGILNQHSNVIETNFDSWEELFECYCEFCIGLFGNKC